MTTYLNTSLETYKQFAELSKKMAEDFLKEYKLHSEDSIRIEKDEHNGDELIINPTNEVGVTAYVEIEERINVEELYKNVVRSIAENVFGTLSRFDFEGKTFDSEEIRELRRKNAAESNRRLKIETREMFLNTKLGTPPSMSIRNVKFS